MHILIFKSKTLFGWCLGFLNVIGHEHYALLWFSKFAIGIFDSGAVMIVSVAMTVVVKDDIDTGLGLVQVEGQGAILGDVLAQDPSRERLEGIEISICCW